MKSPEEAADNFVKVLHAKHPIKYPTTEEIVLSRRKKAIEILTQLLSNLDEPNQRLLFRWMCLHPSKIAMLLLDEFTTAEAEAEVIEEAMDKRVAIYNALINWPKERPLCFAEIARSTGVSREWVRILARQYGFKSTFRVRIPDTTCPVCGESFHPNKRSQIFHSIACANKSKRKGQMSKCEVCGAPIYSRPYQVKAGLQRRFCSHKCNGKWLASHFGFKKKETIEEGK